MSMKNLISVFDMSCEDIVKVFELAAQLKKEQKNGVPHRLLEGKSLGMIFSKSSTRTRVSFEVGMYQLGGTALFLSSNDIQLGRGETISDTSKVLSRYLDGIMIRTYDHSDVVELARFGSIPVINGLTDLMHPCQALTDIFTVYEIFGSIGLKGLKLAYVGDGNNVANSLLHACAKVGMNISIATPKGYECNASIIKEAESDAVNSGSIIEIVNDPEVAVENAHVIYTDTWVSMGQEEEKAGRIELFKNYQVNRSLFSHATKDAIFLHCLPAYRGFEVTGEIIDGVRSKVFEQAENRLHVQKAIILILMRN